MNVPSPAPAKMKRCSLKKANAEAALKPAYICGRPPYGYCVIDGRLQHQPKQQEAVLHAFALAEKGASLSDIVASLQGKYRLGSNGKAQYWDRVKLRRIWSHVPLYTQGTYTTSAGQILVMPELAFLAEEYGQVPYPSPPGRAAAMAAVPSRSGKGRIGATASTPSRRRS